MIPLLLVDGDRLFARLFLAIVLVTTYEAGFVTIVGSTPGKVIAGTRVVALDRPRVEPGDAIKRGLLVAISIFVIVLAPLMLIGTASVESTNRAASVAVAALLGALALAILFSVFGSPLRRSFIDRVCGTFVVTRTTTATVSTRSLDDLTAVSRPRARSRWGELATFDQRRRARAGRLDDAPFLVLAVLVVVFATSVPHLDPWIVVLLGLLWEVVFVLDETWRVSRRGGTGGHRNLALAVVDTSSGEAPGPWRSLARAVLVSFPLYVLPLGALMSLALLGDHPLMLVPLVICGALLLGFVASVRMTAGRGIHDIAAHTEVVELSNNDHGRQLAEDRTG